MTEQVKGCLCQNKRHPKEWHCIVNTSKLKSTFLADFPFGHPPTKGAGYWSREEFHKIKNWGKNR